MFMFWLFWTAGLRRMSEKGSMGGWVVWWWSATLTLVVFAPLDKCCLSLSSRLSPTLSPPVPFPNKPCFDFSVRPASTMASTIMRKRPSLSRPRWGKWEEIEEPSIFMIHSSICQVSWVSWGRKITSLFLGSVFSSLALEFETLWHCAFQMLKLALVEIFRLLDPLFSFAAMSPPAVSEDWRIAWVFPLFLGRHSGTVASSNILLSNKQLVLERDFDLNPLWRRPLDRYWHFRPSPILVCAWCHFQYKSEVTFFDKSHHWNLKINPIKTTKTSFL